MNIVTDAWLFLVYIKDNRTWWIIMADGEIGIRFHYLPWSCSTLSWYSENEWTFFNSRTRPVGSGIQFIIASLKRSTNHFVHGFAYGRLSFVHVHTFTASPVTHHWQGSLTNNLTRKFYQATGLELTSFRSTASLFILPSGEPLRCLVVVHDGFVNCCTLVLRALIWFKWLSALQIFRFHA